MYYIICINIDTKILHSSKFRYTIDLLTPHYYTLPTDRSIFLLNKQKEKSFLPCQANEFL